MLTQAPTRSRLTPAQERAVARRSESLLLSAGAGSGKTSVLVERFARAVIEDRVPPQRILAITFTERAAGELRERIAARLLAAGERAAARELESAFIGTFHGYCARLLRAHGTLADVGVDFAILEERIAGWLRARAFTLALRELTGSGREDVTELIAAYGAERARAITLDAYATLRSKGQRCPRLPTPALECAHEQGGEPRGEGGADGLDAVHAWGLFAELLERFGSTYEELKAQRGALDFDDLELFAGELLTRHDDVREVTAARFDLLMVDEFQDCNARELTIVEALERENLFTVGDEQQAIYGFRHADVELFRARRARLEQRDASLRLSENFRSRGEILAFVNAVFSARLDGAFEELEAAREQFSERESLERESSQDPRVELLVTAKRGWPTGEPRGAGAGTRTAPVWRVAEARALAARVHELVVRDGEARAGEVAVLLRALGDCEIYEGALRERGLRTVAPAGSFWAREQVCDLVSYVRVLANPLDELALYSTLASPLAGISRGALALLARAARTRARSPWEELRELPDDLRAQLREHDCAALAGFGERLANERVAARGRSIARLLERALAWSGYREHVLAQPDGERRIANVHKLLAIAREFERREGRDVRAFVDYVALLAEGRGAAEAEAPVAAEGEDAVTLLSIHSAKGLEFPVVCVADLGRALNVSAPDLLVDGDRVGLRLASLRGDELEPVFDFAELAAERRRAQAQEEDRILYVAMTRARERLVLSGALDLERPPRPRADEPPIAWLVRALDDDADAAALARRLINAPDDAAPAEPQEEAVGAGERSQQALFGPPAAPDHAADADAAARRPEEGPAPAIDSLSYTALSQLERCSYRYYLERTLGLAERRAGGRRQALPDGTAARRAAATKNGAPRDEGARTSARARGMLVHRLLETATAREDAVGDGEISAAASQLGIRIAKAERAEVARLVRRARAPQGLFARLEHARSVHREHPFAFVLGERETLITGVVDVLAYEQDDKALIVDYKTDRVADGEGLEETVEREYSLQRLIYALALLRGGAKQVEIVHWFLEREDGCVSARYAAGELQALEEALGKRVDDALAEGYVPSQRPHRALCATCPGRGGLCSWGEAETMRESALADAVENH